MRLIFEDEMKPELIDMFTFFDKFAKGIDSFMGPPEEPECHFFHHKDKENNPLDTKAILHLNMTFLRVASKMPQPITKLNAYAFLTFERWKLCEREERNRKMGIPS